MRSRCDVRQGARDTIFHTRTVLTHAERLPRSFSASPNWQVEFFSAAPGTEACFGYVLARPVSAQNITVCIVGLRNKSLVIHYRDIMGSCYTDIICFLTAQGSVPVNET